MLLMLPARDVDLLEARRQPLRPQLLPVAGAGPLAGDSWVVVILNRFDKEESITMDWHVDGSIPLGKYAVQVDN